MTTPSPTAGPTTAAEQAEHLKLVRWSCSLGSNVQSRGAVVIQSGDHRWEAAAKGTGPVDALFNAVDKALHDVLTGHPRLLSYDVHAVAEGPDAEGRVTVRVAPPSDAPGPRSRGTYEGVTQSTNIIAASIEAYIEAIEQLLAEEHWQGAADAAGNFRAAPRDTHPRSDYDPQARPDTNRWWDL
jgi:2-isopropylmalate synthase